ncbi:MAG: flippase-like domain-containing protein [Crocinitomicaceae bacterium]|nr:flippase-like domain-containing protein [Crocinitomicaceae bacterium]
MLKTKKNQKNIFLFVKLILFAGVLFVLYSQISQFDKNEWAEFRLVNPISFVVAVLLVYPNIWLAYSKWKLTLSTIGTDSDKKTRIQSFFAGIVTGILTPNMIGNFIGRFYYFERKHRSQIITFTLLCNFAAFVASVTFGTLAVLFMGKIMVVKESHQLVTWLFASVLIAYLFYFFIDNLLARFRKREFAYNFKKILKGNRWYRVKVLGLSYSRFIIFTAQFSLMLHAFGAEWNIYLIAAIWQVYLITMLVPSLFLGKIGVKEAIAIAILGQLEINDFSILFASLIIWFVNTISPALVGFIICRNKDKV